MCLVTKEAYAVVLATDMFKKTNKTHELLETIEYKYRKYADYKTC